MSVVMKKYIHRYFNDLSTNLVVTKSTQWIIETVIQNVRVKVFLILHLYLCKMLEWNEQVVYVYWWQFVKILSASKVRLIYQYSPEQTPCRPHLIMQLWSSQINCTNLDRNRRRNQPLIFFFSPIAFVWFVLLI